MADTGSEYASYRVSCMNMQHGRVQNKALSIATHICSEMAELVTQVLLMAWLPVAYIGCFSG